VSFNSAFAIWIVNFDFEEEIVFVIEILQETAARHVLKIFIIIIVTGTATLILSGSCVQHKKNYLKVDFEKNKNYSQ
jgi:hypothetical protein